MSQEEPFQINVNQHSETQPDPTLTLPQFKALLAYYKGLVYETYHPLSFQQEHALFAEEVL
ncbi:hypothetical protein [Spirosoma soli]|uniref:hypothetical protein n=1 Tax=Spirosoma soli TaxID=1770529 RepID=UPI0036D40A2D